MDPAHCIRPRDQDLHALFLRTGNIGSDPGELWIPGGELKVLLAGILFIFRRDSVGALQSLQPTPTQITINTNDMYSVHISLSIDGGAC